VKAIFVRHGKDDERYRGGWSQLDLTEEGRVQAKALAARLGERRGEPAIGRILTSDLPRAMTTAQILARELKLPVQAEPRLREIDNGVLAGMLNETALERYPGLYFSSLGMDEAYPEGESPNAFYRRIRDWLEDFCREYRDSGENVLIVTHQGVINIVYHLVRGVPWRNRSKGFPCKPCSMHVLDLETMRMEE